MKTIFTELQVKVLPADKVIVGCFVRETLSGMLYVATIGSYGTNITEAGIPNGPYPDLKPHHLYITENRLISEGEYFIDTHNKTVHRWEMGEGIHKGKTCWCDVIVASSNTNLEGVAKVPADFMKSFTTKPVETVAVEFEPYMTGGWVPSYNNPDNFNLDEPAEIDYRLVLDDDNTINVK